MYSHVSVTTVNPITSSLSFDDLKASLIEKITAAAQGRLHELHSVIMLAATLYSSLFPGADMSKARLN